MSKPFHLKTFSICDDISTMKVGTDSILLGSWIGGNHYNNILDIGCGCGILSMMMADKFKDALVSAIDIDTASVKQCRENAIACNFSDRLEVYREDVRIFASNVMNKFDLIVSNPPFFIDSLKTGNLQRDRARHTDTLSYSELIDSANSLLLPHGKFFVVLPFNEGHDFINLAQQRGFYNSKTLNIITKVGKGVSRLLIELGKSPKAHHEDTLILRDEANKPTSDYIRITQNYYISLK
ncbi:MAG: tRNA1(Val) (adenine(37)-N6)-methyltransferase [Hyphomicrobiales bacterium]